MNATQARQFEQYSERNASLVEDHFTCGCKAYESVFTYPRWRAQGKQVQKGEKAYQILTYIPIVVTNEKGEREVVATRPKTSSVFCQHQVA